MPANPVDVARLFLHVREAGPNTGQRVEAIQKWCGGTAGQSWCCYFVTMVLDLAFGGASPIPRQGACQGVYDLAKRNKWVTATPSVGDIYLYVTAADDHAHHVGFYLGEGATPGSISTLSGNTSADGASSNGDRVAEHDVTPKPGAVVYVAYPR
jgi:hypothetical protein